MGRPLAKESKSRILKFHIEKYKEANARIVTIQNHFFNIALLPGVGVKQGIRKWNYCEMQIYSILKHQIMIDNFTKILTGEQKDLWLMLLDDYNTKELMQEFKLGARSVGDRIEALAEKFVKYKERIYGEQKDIKEYC